MKINEILPHIQHANVAIFTKIDTGTKEMFTVEICRGQRIGTCRKEFIDWLNSLNLEVEKIGVCSEDTCGNEDLLCIHCKPIRIEQVYDRSNGKTYTWEDEGRGND